MAIILLNGERILKWKSMVNMMNEGVKTTRLTGEESTEVEGLDLRRLRLAIFDTKAYKIIREKSKVDKINRKYETD